MQERRGARKRHAVPTSFTTSLTPLKTGFPAGLPLALLDTRNVCFGVHAYINSSSSSTPLPVLDLLCSCSMQIGLMLITCQHFVSRRRLASRLTL